MKGKETMTDNMYTQIQKRTDNAACELTPNLPTENTVEAWESFLEELEGLDITELVWEEIDHWDWTIYTHYGMKIVDSMCGSELHDAESRWHDLDGPSTIDDSFGVYEFASKVAYYHLETVLTEKLDALIEELKELAEDTLDQLKG